VTALTVATAPPAAAAAKVPSCNLKALAAHKGVVNITFWNSMVQANGQTLAAITKSFNASQSKVHVTLVNQASYDDTWQAYQAGLSSGQLPDAVQLEDQRTQEAIDTQSFLPVQSCMNAAHYSTSDYLARPLDYWKVNGVQWALPFAVSAPVLYYNQLAFTKAGLNPNTPPATLPAMLQDAKALKASGSGTGLVLDPWHLETWLATANQLFVNNNNGRTRRATKGVFDTKTAKQIFTDLDLLVKSGDAITNPSSGSGSYDNLLGVGTGKYGMTIDTSAALGTIVQLLVDEGRRRAGWLWRLHLQQGPRTRPSSLVGVPVLSLRYPEHGHLGRRDRVHPGPQVVDQDGDGPKVVDHDARLQGGLRRDRGRGQHAGHVRIGDRAVHRRADRHPHRGDHHVHHVGLTRQVVVQCARRGERHHFGLQQPSGLIAQLRRPSARSQLMVRARPSSRLIGS
jgi:hypothetical protein